MRQIELLPTETSDVPKGFVYRPEFISSEEEQELVKAIEELALGQVKMRGVASKRRVAHFGRTYGFETFKLGAAPAIPDFLLFLRDRAGELARCDPVLFAEALISEYPAGAGIGWHRDAPPFDIIVGISLLAECTMKFRPWPVLAKAAAAAQKRNKPIARVLEPRSAYILQGDARTKWQHHIPPMSRLRYSITFRTLRQS